MSSAVSRSGVGADQASAKRAANSANSSGIDHEADGDHQAPPPPPPENPPPPPEKPPPPPPPDELDCGATWLEKPEPKVLKPELQTPP